MKKVLLLLLTILTLGFVAAPLSAQQTVTIGDSASNYYYYPVNMYFNYSLTQQIYTAAEIEAASGGAGTITAISFYYNYTSSFSMEGIKIYMLNVDKTEFTSSTDMVAVSESDKVYDGTFSATGKGWVTVTLTTPFEYDGSNLLVCCYDPTNGFPGSSYTFNTANTTTYSGCRYYSDTYTPDLNNITSFSGSTAYTKYHNRIRLTITPNPDACYGVASTKTSGVSTNEATFSWSPREGQTDWEVYCGTGDINLEEVEWIPVSLPDTSYTFSGLNANTPYTAYIRTVCGEQYSSPRSASFRTDCDLLTGLPYEENFEDVPSGSNVMPFCWDRDTLSTTYPYAYNSSSSAHQGNRSLYFYSKANTAFLPETDGTINISETQLTFWAKTGTAETPLQIGVVDEEGHFDLVYSLPLTTTYKSYTIPFHLYEGSGTRVALRSTNTTAIYVDDLVWEEIDECTKPISATCTPAVTSADFSWFSNGSTFTLYYKEATASEWEQVDVTGLEYTLDQLTPNTQYKWYVETACGMDTEFRTDSMTFTTTMAPVELPYTATFDEEDEWLLHNGTCTNVWVANEIEEGVNGLFITRDTNTLVKRYKIASAAGTVTAEKAFIIGDAIEYALDFDFRCGGESTWDYIKVFLAPTSNEYPASNSTSVSTWDAYGYSTYAADFTEYLPATYTSTIAPYKLNLTHDSTLHISVIMNNPVENADASTMAKLVFVWRNDGSGATDSTGAIISNIHLEALSCGRPDSLKVSEVEAHTAQVYFAPALESDNAWEYALLHDTMTIEDADIIPVGESSFELSDLLSGTAYTLYVRTACGGDQSAWTNAVNFTTKVTCSAPRNLTISQITGSSALVTWDTAQIGAYGYSVQYKQATEEEWNGDPYESIESPYMLSGLDPQTPYIVKVNSLCDDGESFATKPFTTPCLSGGEVLVGNGTTTSYQIPVNNLWKNCYNEQIFLAEEINGARDINSISFQYNYSTAMTDKTNVSIYLKHTSQSTFSGTSNYIGIGGATLVYQGNLNCHEGWNTFTFNNPFAYNGTDNLVLIVDDNSNDYDNSSCVFNTHSTGSTRALCYYSDSENPDPNNLSAFGGSKTTLTVRNNVKFGGECDETIPCLAPNAYLSDITSESVTVNWVPGYDETEWVLEYHADGDTIWIPADASNSPSVVDGLNANTLYTFRLKSVCGDEYSNPKTMQARTNCSEEGVIALPFRENFDTYGTGADAYPYCWSKINTYTAAVMPRINAHTDDGGVGCLYFYTATASTYSIAITPMFNFDVNTLQASFMYKGNSSTDRLIVGVMTNPDSANTFVPVDTIVPAATASQWGERIVRFDTYEGEGQYIAFKNQYTSAGTYTYIDDLVIDEIPYCAKPTDVVATSTPHDTAKIAWTAQGGEAWDIIYGPIGFNPEDEATAIDIIEGVTENPYTIDGLASGMGYDFYVRTNCGDEVSEWSNTHGSAYPYAIAMGQTGADTLIGCGFTITDNGGPNGKYTNSCDFIMVIYPSDEDSLVSVSGVFAGEGQADYLQIYSGAQAIDANLIKKVYSTMNGGTSGSQISFGPYTSELGPLTLKFHSDGSIVYDGFVAFTSCVPAPTCASPVKNSVTISNIDGHNATVHFVDNDEDHTSWTVHYRPTNATAEDEWLTVLSEEDTTMALLTNLAPLTQYDVYVTTNCDIPDEVADATYTEHFTTTVACPAPQNVTAESIGTNTATISWQSNAASFIIELIETGASQEDIEPQVVEDNFIELTDLTPVTTYTLRITADCGEDSLSGKATFTFTTACETFTDYPYIEDFATNSSTRNCWSSIDANNDNKTFTYNSSNQCMDYTYHGTNAANDWLISPIFLLDGTQIADFDYWCSSSWAEKFQVFAIAEDGTETALTDVITVQTATHQNIQFDFNELTGNYKVGIHCVSDPNKFHLYIDNFRIRSTDVAEMTVDPSTLTFANAFVNVPTAAKTAVVTGMGLTEAITATATTNFEVSADGNTFGPTATFEVEGLMTSETLYVRCSATTAGALEGMVIVTSGTLADTITLTGNAVDVTPVSLPYSTDFTAATDQNWFLNNGTLTNHWTMGTIQNHGALYVTKDSTSASYAHNATTVMAEKFFNMPTGDSVHVEFDLTVGGENGWDYLKVFLAPASAEFTAGTGHNTYSDKDSTRFAMNFSPYSAQLYSGASSITSYLYTASKGTGTIHVSQNMPIPANSSTAKLVFLWRNDGSVGDGNSAVISNFSIEATGSTPVVTNPTVVTDPVSNLGETNATLNGTINNPSGVTLTGKGFKWQQDGAATFNDQPVTGNVLTHTLTGLTANTTYRYKAYISYADTTVYGNEVTFTTNGGSTPTNPTVATNDVTDRTQTSAILHATITNPSNVEITAKGFEWRATTGGTFAPITGTGTGNEFTATLTGLQANTSYTYKAFITYAGGTTVYGSTVTFTTLPEDVQPCATPQNVTAVSHSKESIDVSWDANADVTAWNIQYRKQNVETWSTANTTENSYTIGGLTPETTYEIQVQAVCSSGSESDWTASVTATTLPDGLQEHLASQIVLYPNPAKEFVTVQCTENGQFEVTGIEVFDVYGKLINTVDVVENPTRINVSSLANGMYFVRVTTDAGAVTKTFVKK